MDPIGILVGATGIVIGVANLYQWIANRQTSTKATQMKERWGESRGRLIHGLSYGVLPLVVGVIFLLYGF